MRVACQAMATRFELVLEGDDPARLRAAGEEAIAEIHRLEAELSFFRPTSDVGRINAGAAAAPVRVGAATVELLERARTLHGRTGGAFDVTVGPLTRCWRAAAERGAPPAPATLEEARARVGMELVEVDARARTVRFARPGVLVDLGAIGKGYAIERAAAILAELGVAAALVHGGTSTVHGVGRPREGGAWRVAIEPPEGDAADAAPLAVVELQDRSLSVSAPTGREFRVGDVRYGHVLDPRTGWPAQGAALAAVVAPSAADSDALSTALLTLGVDGCGAVADGWPALPLLVVGAGGAPVVRRGIGAVSPV